MISQHSAVQCFLSRQAFDHGECPASLVTKAYEELPNNHCRTTSQKNGQR